MKRVSVVNIALCMLCLCLVFARSERYLFLFFVFPFWLKERESAVSEAYRKGVKEGKEQAGAYEKQPLVNVTDEVS